jgi:hypothetical protein
VLNFAKHLHGFRVRGVSAPRKADDSCAPLVRSVRPDQVSEIFETSEQAIYGLLAHPSALGENAGASPIGARKSEERHVRQAEFRKARRIQIVDDTPVNGLGRNAQQRADEHVAGFDR